MRFGIAIAASIGAMLILMGTLLPWVGDPTLLNEGFELNGFDIGYVTDPEGGDSGIDGVLTLAASLVAVGLALIYLFGGSAWATLGMILTGLVAGVIGGYNFGKIVDDVTIDPHVSTSEALDLVGEGLYLIIAGGIVLALTGFAALGAAQAPHRVITIEGARGRR